MERLRSSWTGRAVGLVIGTGTLAAKIQQPLDIGARRATIGRTGKTAPARTEDDR